MPIFCRWRGFVEAESRSRPRFQHAAMRGIEAQHVVGPGPVRGCLHRTGEVDLTFLHGSWLMAQAAEQPDVNPLLTFMPWIILALLLYVMVLRPQQREMARRREMLSALKKNDKVITQSGIIGTVANVSPDEDEVTLKVDDNTRIKFLKSAITEVVRPTDGDAPKAKS